jgi:ketosteroid isomerase-like protein
VHADGDRVIVQAHSAATTVRGEPYDQYYCFVFRVDGGWLLEVTEYCDTALVERVLEPL